jgi:hypothetical protein
MNDDIPKETVEQYERIRKAGFVNMLSYVQVVEIADILGFDDLADLSREGYCYLLQNYSRLMQLYNLT